MAFNVGTLEASSAIDQSGFKRAIGAMHKEGVSFTQDFRRSMQRISQDLTSLGRTLTTRVTLPLAGLGAVAFRAFGQQEQAEMKLRAALQANGREVDRLFGKYNAFAQEMQRLTVVGDEATLAMLAQAEAMGVTGDSAERAVQNAISMQAAFDVSAERALRYTAALEQGEATMLRRYIPALRGIEDSSEMVAEAQRILGDSFAIAEAQAQSATGQFQQMRNALGDAMEEVGAVVSEAIMPMIQRVKELAEQFQELDRESKIFIVTAAGIAAAIGPVLVVLGQLAKAIAVIMSPLFAKIAAIVALTGAIVYLGRNWRAVAEFIRDEWQKTVNDVIYNAQLLLKGLDMLLGAFSHISLGLQPVIAAMDQLKHEIPDRSDGYGFESFGSFVSGIGGYVTDALKWVAGQFVDFERTVRDTTSNVNKSVREIDFQPAIDQARELEQVLIATDAHDLSRLVESVDDQIAELDRLEDAAVNMGYALQSVVADAIIEFSRTLSDALTGDAGVRGFFNSILAVVASFSEQLGRSLVAAGVAAMAFKKLLSNPIAAIAAGSALIVAAGVTRALLASGPDRQVNDALITNDGRVIQFHPNDNLLAMKDFSALAGVGQQAQPQRIIVDVRGSVKGSDIAFITERIQQEQARTGRR